MFQKRSVDEEEYVTNVTVSLNTAGDDTVTVYKQFDTPVTHEEAVLIVLEEVEARLEDMFVFVINIVIDRFDLITSLTVTEEVNDNIVNVEISGYVTEEEYTRRRRRQTSLSIGGGIKGGKPFIEAKITIKF